jgi:hypothetical protein
MPFFSDAKDRLLETIAVPVLNRTLFAPYGRLRDLRLNSAENSAEALVDLNGEREPVRVFVDRYDVLRRGSETFVTFRAVRTSRGWMTALAERNLVGRAFRLPREFGWLFARLV